MKTELFYGTINPLYTDALTIRHTVFTVEQGFASELDADSIDAYAWHVVLYNKGQAIATARLYSNPLEKSYTIGRVAVLTTYRKQKIGSFIMDVLLKQAMAEAKHQSVTIHAQLPVVHFYETLGFAITGETFEEDGAPHVPMALTLAIRGFQVAQGFEHSPVVLPERKTKASSGYDLSLIEITIIPAKSSVLAKTGLKAYMLDDEVLELYIRSSIAIKRNVWCANNVGVIDADYYNNPDNDGHIMIPLYNANDVPVTLEQGERVAQGIFKKYLTVDGEDNATFAARVGGFGSTGTQ